MATSLTNYREVGKSGVSDTGAGFQFEFTCSNCASTWKSPFRPYRRGQLAGLVYKFAYYLGDRGNVSRGLSDLASSGSNRARQTALNEALELAGQRYSECRGCHRFVCEDCWDERAQLCEQCRNDGGRSGRTNAGRRERPAADDEPRAMRAAVLKCANCNAPLDGGRFCAECGFDVASTHKSCPACGTLCTRAARFCTDCGHGF